MRVIMVTVAFAAVSQTALAQSAADPMTRSRACSQLEQAERVVCLDKLPGAGDEWVISETTSPVDYAPIVTATAFSRDSASASLAQLSVLCRGGRTEMVVGGPALASSSTDYDLSYRLNSGQPVRVAAGRASLGTGIAFRGDVVSLLRSLPEEGELAIRLSARSGVVHEGHFSLSGLKAVRSKVAAACNWPRSAKPGSE
jgi:hypothetical protein